METIRLYGRIKPPIETGDEPFVGLYVQPDDKHAIELTAVGCLRALRAVTGPGPLSISVLTALADQEVDYAAPEDAANHWRVRMGARDVLRALKEAIQHHGNRLTYVL